MCDRRTELDRLRRELEAERSRRRAAEEKHRQLLEQLSHADRVSTLDEMASGLAHELNQPLGAVANYVGGCLERIDLGTVDLDELRSALERAQEATLRAGEIVRRVRRFATRHEFAAADIDPSRLVGEVAEFLRDEADRRGVRLETETAPDLPTVRGDTVQLQQVLVNLIRNALDAVEAAKSMNPKVLVTASRSPDGSVAFSVIDNGEGLERDRLKRMFEPFFSTRAEGMGMGLAISRGIVEAHHGRIEAESEPGVRTTVRFTLPPAQARGAQPVGFDV